MPAPNPRARLAARLAQLTDTQLCDTLEGLQAKADDGPFDGSKDQLWRLDAAEQVLHAAVLAELEARHPDVTDTAQEEWYAGLADDAPALVADAVRVVIAAVRAEGTDRTARLQLAPPAP